MPKARRSFKNNNPGSVKTDTPAGFERFVKKKPERNFSGPSAEEKAKDRPRFNKRPFEKKINPFKPDNRKTPDDTEKPYVDTAKTLSEEVPLNKFVAHSGICGRREAAEMVKEGKIKVNNEVVTNPAYRVQPADNVTFNGKRLSSVVNRVYLLLNKPKGFITTTSDERGRKTVMDLVASAEAGRLYPVGRLDRNTTGLLLLTNDGELAQKLSHPSNKVKKIYKATLNKPLTTQHFEEITRGLTLDDGVAKVDEIAYIDEENTYGLEIHSGKNRIVRRIFEHLGYDVTALDRVLYAGLTKKNLPRGKYRRLTDQELIFLKHFK